MRLSLLLVVLLAGPTAVRAQVSPRCEGPEFRHFDFWVGEWTVTDPDGAEVGRSVIESVLEGCVIRETWDSGQVKGTSLSIFDAPNDEWAQTWVDNRGALLRVQGGWDGESMTMAGERRGSDGRTRRLRITWSPRADGTVLQRQEVSEDGGETWAVTFEGIYQPAR